MTGCVRSASVPAASAVRSGRPGTLALVSGGRGIRTHGDVAATMVFKSFRDLLSATASSWTFSMSVVCVIQDHPAHIP